MSKVTRCRNCEYYIPYESMKNDVAYKDYENKLDADGLCDSTDTWIDEDDCCSSAKRISNSEEIEVEEEQEDNFSEVTKVIARHLFECVMDIRDLGYTYEDFEDLDY